MTKHIYKYTLERFSDGVQMPEDAKILKLGFQGTDMCIWAEVSKDAPSVLHRMAVVATGEAVPPVPHKYLETLELKGYVFHIYLLP